MSRQTRRVRLLLCVGVPSPGPIDRWEIATHSVNEVIFTPLNTTVLSTPLVVLVYASSWQCIQVGAVDRVDPSQIQPYFLNWIRVHSTFSPTKWRCEVSDSSHVRATKSKAREVGAARQMYVCNVCGTIGREGACCDLASTLSGSCVKAAALSRTPQHVHDRLHAYTRSVAPPSVFST